MRGGAGVTAVVVDRWPLVRLGLSGVLARSGIEVVGEAAKVSEGLLLVRLRSAGLLIFGSPLDGLSPTAIRSARHDQAPPKIVVLVAPDAATGAEVSGLFAAGVDALLLASVGSEELADALVRITRGERVVGPELGLDHGGEPAREAAPAGEAGPLTAKELEVLILLSQGHSNKQIARALYVSDATIKTHLQHIYVKLAVQSRFGALTRAAELGLLP